MSAFTAIILEHIDNVRIALARFDKLRRNRNYRWESDYPITFEQNCDGTWGVSRDEIRTLTACDVLGILYWNAEHDYDNLVDAAFTIEDAGNVMFTNEEPEIEPGKLPIIKAYCKSLDSLRRLVRGLAKFKRGAYDRLCASFITVSRQRYQRCPSHVIKAIEDDKATKVRFEHLKHEAAEILKNYLDKNVSWGYLGAFINLQTAYNDMCCGCKCVGNLILSESNNGKLEQLIRTVRKFELTQYTTFSVNN
jgi:hypothetical protein